MSEKQLKGWEAVHLDSRQRLVEEVKRRAKEQGLTGKALAARIGVSPAWVTSFYKDLAKDEPAIRPGEDAIRAIAHALGADLLQWTPFAGSVEKEHDNELGMALLWNARATLLNHLSYAEHANPKVVRLLKHLSDNLYAASANHPFGKKHSVNGRMRSLEEMASSTPAILRHLVFAELLFMNLDAPFESGFDPKLKWRMLTRLGQELQIPEKSIEIVLRDFKREIEQHNHQPAVSGALGQIYFPISNINSLLVGHDPSGWFGFPFISGSWLVKGLNDLKRSESHNNAPIQNLGWKGTALTAAAIGSAVNFLGPVVGLLVATAAVEKVTTTRNVTPNPSETPQRNAPNLIAQSIAEAAIAFGPNATFIEENKIRAFYYSIEYDSSKVKTADLKRHGLPEQAVALKNLDSVREVLKSSRETIKELGVPANSKLVKDISLTVERTIAVRLESLRNGRIPRK